MVRSGRIGGSGGGAYSSRLSKVKPARASGRQKWKASETEIHESIDPLLEKISEHGLASLSEDEKKQLEKRGVLVEKRAGGWRLEGACPRWS